MKLNLQSQSKFHLLNRLLWYIFLLTQILKIFYLDHSQNLYLLYLLLQLIGERAFGNCSGLTSVTIPNSVTFIGRFAFENCSGLQKVIVPDIAAWCGISFGDYESNPLYYANHLYSDENTEITDLVIPNGVTNIKYYAFYN